MWPVAGIPEGSFYFNNEPNQLDQFLVNANLARPTSEASCCYTAGDHLASR